MEIIIIIAVYGGLLYWIYKLALSKNRNAAAYTLAGLIVSPIIILIILAILGKLPSSKIKKKSKK
tara:strand:- start:42 stop:236 length:195 start_codon:yes stop_codon:yes gene_type:complete